MLIIQEQVFRVICWGDEHSSAGMLNIVIAFFRNILSGLWSPMHEYDADVYSQVY